MRPIICNCELECPLSSNFKPLIYPIYCALVRENEVLQQVERVDHAVRWVVVNSDWKRVRVKTDVFAVWVALGSLKGSEPSMMRVAEASKRQLDMITNLEGGYCQGKKVSPQLFSRCHLAMPVSYFRFDLAASLKNCPLCP
jgi:hypothetical protein